MNIACPDCETVYRLDPDRITDGAAAARCRECGATFRVHGDLGPTGPGQHATAQALPAAPAPSEPEAGSRHEASPAPAADAPAPAADADDTEAAPVFGPQDPDTRARRLARALVSDIKVYHPEKWEKSVRAGTLRADFRDEVLKSWEEYVEQVGEEMAKKTPFFRDALNQILADGERVF